MSTIALSRTGTLATIATLAFTLASGVASANPANETTRTGPVATAGATIETSDGSSTAADALPSETIANGVTVPISTQERAKANEVFSSQGLEQLPADVVAFKMEGDTVSYLNQSGQTVTTSDDREVALSTQNAVLDHIKKVVGGCLGVDFYAQNGLWVAIQNSVNTWDKAAKFVIRRVGWIAAVTCGGGVLAAYL